MNKCTSNPPTQWMLNVGGHREEQGQRNDVYNASCFNKMHRTRVCKLWATKLVASAISPLWGKNTQGEKYVVQHSHLYLILSNLGTLGTLLIYLFF